MRSSDFPHAFSTLSHPRPSSISPQPMRSSFHTEEGVSSSARAKRNGDRYHHSRAGPADQHASYVHRQHHRHRDNNRYNDDFEAAADVSPPHPSDAIFTPPSFLAEETAVLLSKMTFMERISLVKPYMTHLKLLPEDLRSQSYIVLTYKDDQNDHGLGAITCELDFFLQNVQRYQFPSPASIAPLLRCACCPQLPLEVSSLLLPLGSQSLLSREDVDFFFASVREESIAAIRPHCPAAVLASEASSLSLSLITSSLPPPTYKHHMGYYQNYENHAVASSSFSPKPVPFGVGAGIACLPQPSASSSSSSSSLYEVILKAHINRVAFRWPLDESVETLLRSSSGNSHRFGGQRDGDGRLLTASSSSLIIPNQPHHCNEAFHRRLLLSLEHHLFHRVLVPTFLEVKHAIERQAAVETVEQTLRSQSIEESERCLRKGLLLLFHWSQRVLLEGGGGGGHRVVLTGSARNDGDAAVGDDDVSVVIDNALDEFREASDRVLADGGGAGVVVGRLSALFSNSLLVNKRLFAGASRIGGVFSSLHDSAFVDSPLKAFSLGGSNRDHDSDKCDNDDVNTPLSEEEKATVHSANPLARCLKSFEPFVGTVFDRRATAIGPPFAFRAVASSFASSTAKSASESKGRSSIESLELAARHRLWVACYVPRLLGEAYGVPQEEALARAMLVCEEERARWEAAAQITTVEGRAEDDVSAAVHRYPAAVLSPYHGIGDGVAALSHLTVTQLVVTQGLEPKGRADIATEEAEARRSGVEALFASEHKVIVTQLAATCEGQRRAFWNTMMASREYFVATEADERLQLEHIINILYRAALKRCGRLP